MVALYLLTALSTACALAAGLSAWVSWRWSLEVKDEANELHKAMRLLRTNEAALENLQAQVKSLRGLVYKRTSPDFLVDEPLPDGAVTETPEMTRQRLREQHGLPRFGGGASKGE